MGLAVEWDKIFLSSLSMVYDKPVLICNGVFNLEDKAGDDDIVIVHDGIRPLVDAEVLTDVIKTAQRYGNGVT